MTSSKPPGNSNTEFDSTDQAWLSDVLSKHLDNEADNLDFVVSSKLKAARHRALAQDDSAVSDKKKPFSWLPAPTMIVPVAVVTLALFLGQQLILDKPETTTQTQQQTALSPTGVIEDLHMLSGSDEIEFFQSMEMLEWMDSNSG